MGTPFKYLIPIILLAVSLVGYQNCGGAFHGNGDPYEVGGDDRVLPGTGTDSEPGNGLEPGDSQGLPPADAVTSFVSENECNPRVSGGAISQVAFGQTSVPVLQIKTEGGDAVYFVWDESSAVQTINSVVGKTFVTTIVVSASDSSASSKRKISVTTGQGVSSVTNVFDCAK